MSYNYTACVDSNGQMIVGQVADGEYSHECEACSCSLKNYPNRPCGDDMTWITTRNPCSSLSNKCACGSQGGIHPGYAGEGRHQFSLCCAKQKPTDPGWKQCEGAEKCCVAYCHKYKDPSVAYSNCVDGCLTGREDDCASGCFGGQGPPPLVGPGPSPPVGPGPSPGPPGPRPKPPARKLAAVKPFLEKPEGKAVVSSAAVAAPILAAGLLYWILL